MAEKPAVVVHEEPREADARIVVGFLQAKGIRAMIFEDDAGDQLPALELTRGVKILVPARDAERARELLRAREAGAADSV
jgi:hypothetical protein